MTLVEALSKMTQNYEQLAAAVNDKIKRTKMVRRLIEQRAISGLSQQEVADKMHCSLERVDEIEHGFDSDVSEAELALYSRVVSVNLPK